MKDFGQKNTWKVSKEECHKVRDVFGIIPGICICFLVSTNIKCVNKKARKNLKQENSY